MSLTFLELLSKKLDICSYKDSQFCCYLTYKTMNTSLKHLSPGQQRSLQRVISIIVRAVQPEKILLFGVHGGIHGSSTTSRGLTDAGTPTDVVANNPPPVLGAYDLLVVGREGDRRSDYELQDLIENRCREVAPVTVLVHDISYVNRRLGEGQYFFYSVIREGIVLYDAGHQPFSSVRPADW